MIACICYKQLVHSSRVECLWKFAKYSNWDVYSDTNSSGGKAYTPDILHFIVLSVEFSAFFNVVFYIFQSLTINLTLFFDVIFVYDNSK